MISVFFKKVKYNIPVVLVYPQGYPNDPPSLYVIPTQTMVLNLNNKSVSQDGKIALQVLKKWKKKPASLEILEEARKLFEKNSPLFSTTGVVQLQSYPSQNSQVTNSNPTIVPTSSGLINSAFSALSSILSSGSSSNQSSMGNNHLNQNISPNSYPIINSVDPNNGPPKSAQGPQPVHPIHSTYPAPSPLPRHSALPAHHSSPQQPNYITSSSALPLTAVPLSSSSSSQSQTPPIYPNPSLPDQSPPTKPQVQISQIKLHYLNRLKHLQDEIKILSQEKEGLIRNKTIIDEDLMNYSGQLNQIYIKKNLIKASIENTEEWLQQVKSSNNLKLEENDLVEYRNEYAKEFLMFSAKEKSLENVVMVIIDSMNKKLVSFKDGITTAKAIFSEIFIVARMKEKVLSLS